MSFLASRDSGTKRGSRLLAVRCVPKDRCVVLGAIVPLSTLAAFARLVFFKIYFKYL